MRKFTTNMKRGLAAVASTAFVAAANAGVYADAVTDGIDPAEVTLIGVAVLGVVGIIYLIKSGRRAAS